MRAIKEINGMKDTEILAGRIRRGIGWCLLVVLYFTNMIYVGLNGQKLINSDSAADMVLAAYLNREHGIVSTNWYYSTELRVLHNHLVFKLGLLLFPHNWHMARTFSVAIFLLLLIACGAYLCHVLETPALTPWLGSALIAPIGKWYASYAIYDSHYTLHIAVSMFSLALCLHLVKIWKLRKRRAVFLAIVLLALCFVEGLGGIRLLLVFYAPFAVACLLFFLPRHFRINPVLPGLSVAMLIISGIGYLVNSKVLVKIFAFTTWGDMQFEAFDLTKLLHVIGGYFSLFGWKEEVKVISLSGMGNLLSVVLVLMLVVAAVVMLDRVLRGSGQREADGWDVVTVFVWVDFVLLSVIYASYGGYDESYWTVLPPWGLLLVFMAIRDQADKIRSWMLELFLVAAFLMCSYSTMKYPYVSWVPNDLKLLEVSDFLKESNYTQGLATFWNGQIVTELTDGKVEMMSVYDYAVPIIHPWLQKKWEEPNPEGRFFILYGEGEVLPVNWEDDRIWEHILYQDANYIVYGFENWEQYQELLMR
ncbi:MAG: hypothetical protein IJ794_00915 [Lachnospiraceae bacterium]|nr:hypothetical protein [Lachnospiraceae bacterium]